MRTGLVSEMLPLLTLLTGCMSDGEFDVRLAFISDGADADAAAAHRCADELRVVADGAPFIAGTVLEMQNGMSALGTPPMPAPVVARRAREELAWRERAVEAARNTIHSVRGIGPAALESAIEAERLTRGARDRLCQARDVATTIAAMTSHRRPAVGIVTVGK